MRSACRAFNKIVNDLGGVDVRRPVSDEFYPTSDYGVYGVERIDIAPDRTSCKANCIADTNEYKNLAWRELFDQHVDLGAAAGRVAIGDKALTLIMSALAGGDCIDDAGALRAGATGRVLGHSLRAPPTLGTYLRSFSWGHARQLDAVSRAAIARAWAASAGPGSAPLTIDLDSTICETYGLHKQGGTHFTHNQVRGYHPLLAVAAPSGDVLHGRLRGARRTAAAARRTSCARPSAASARRAPEARSPWAPTPPSYNASVVRVCRSRGALLDQRAPPGGAAGAHRGDPGGRVDGAIPYWQVGGADVAEIAFTPFATERDAEEVRLIVSPRGNCRRRNLRAIRAANLEGMPWSAAMGRTLARTVPSKTLSAPGSAMSLPSQGEQQPRRPALRDAGRPGQHDGVTPCASFLCPACAER